MDGLVSLLARDGYLPHGYCFTWSPGLLGSMVTDDALIALAYFSIPVTILRFARQRPDPTIRWVAWLFSAFIFACGITHVMDIWTIWVPDYAAQTLTKAITAAISVATAVVIWRLLPNALALPSPTQFSAATGSLDAEVRKRRSATEHLLDTERTLEMALGSIGAGLVVCDSQGCITRMNTLAEQVTGWTRTEALGRGVQQVFVREDHPVGTEARNPLDEMVERGPGAPTTERLVVIARDGTRTAVELRAAVIHDDAGVARGFTMVFRDLTRLNDAEAELRRLAAIVESSSDAIISEALNGRITSWNRAAESMFGYTAAEAIGQRVQMLIPPEREAEEMRILTDLAVGRSVPAFDTVRIAKDGRRLDASIALSPVRDASGRIVGGSKIARDLSPQRRAEAASRLASARLRFALDSAQIGEWEMDLTTGQGRRSLRHDFCFGYQAMRPDWDFDIFLNHVHPDDRAEVARSFHASVTQRKDWHVTCRVVWPDASVHWVSMHGGLLRDAGASDRLVGIVADVTQEKLVEEARLKAQRLETENRQIQEANRLKSQFLANMSHELRTPLNAIIGFAELMHSGAVPTGSPQTQIFLGHIATSGHHLLQLINDVLDLAKVESGKFEFAPEPVDVQQLATEVGNVLLTAIGRKGLKLSVEIAPDLGEIVVDPARLKQALYNYVSNAIKFTPEGGRVTIRARADGPEHFRLEVEDTGIGIAPADLARLFVEFQQLDAGMSKQHQGTGLGLALTRRLVQAQGGSVGVRSTPGAGSVFHLVLPRAPVAAPDPSSHRLLVLEDDRELQGHIASGLAGSAFTIDAAYSGEQAVLSARAQPYDGITLNLLLPEHGGLAALHGIRSDALNRDSPVLALTMPAEGRAVSFAVANVLAKPLRAEEVVRAMARLAAGRPAPARVMVVDDEPHALDLMRATLAGLGIDAICMHDGRQALRELDEHRPDAIVLDLMMPGFNGFEVLGALRESAVWRDTPVFIWTSMILTDDEVVALTRSAQGIVAKGGGAVTHMIDALTRWRPPAAIAPPDASVT
ncbi:MAG: PAS domain S-box protein [Burkholderiales bacterium]